MNLSSKIEIKALGDSAAVVSFTKLKTDEQIIFARSFATQIEKHRLKGIIEAAAAISSVTIWYDPVEILKNADPKPICAFEAVKSFLTNIASNLHIESNSAHAIHTINVQFLKDGPFSDLKEIEKLTSLCAEEIIAELLSTEFEVKMLGFLPGFAYLGDLPEKLRVPRKSTPRKLVPAGSLAIAECFAGIYPFDSPGGWNIVGKTGIKMFDMDKNPPTLLKPGDRVKFISSGLF
jgi:inhibitor of KinA